MTQFDDEAPSATSSAAHLFDEIALYGVTPGSDERDYRPLPEAEVAEAQINGLMQTMGDLFAGTRLEEEAEEMLWSLVNSFHRRIVHAQKRLDDNEMKQKDAQREQDGSEIRSVELERLVDEGHSLTEIRNTFEAMRDIAGENFHVQTGKAWTPRSGSKVSHQTLTAAMIDSRDYLSAKRRSETETHCPAGTKIAFTGGLDFNQVDPIWDALDKAKAKYPDIVLIHGGNPKGAELIAAKWAANRGVTAVVFKPDWVKHQKAAPFKRNDAMLAVMPQGVIATPGTGITENLVDKARKLGIKVMRVGA